MGACWAVHNVPTGAARDRARRDGFAAANVTKLAEEPPSTCSVSVERLILDHEDNLGDGLGGEYVDVHNVGGSLQLKLGLAKASLTKIRWE
jgi:hypothetical protein